MMVVMLDRASSFLRVEEAMKPYLISGNLVNTVLAGKLCAQCSTQILNDGNRRIQGLAYCLLREQLAPRIET
jgi:hypothetical protein